MKDIDMLYSMLFKRKSFHVFKTPTVPIEADELKEIEEIVGNLKSLDTQIHTAVRIVEGNRIRGFRGAQYCALFYSEKKDNWLTNIGYMGEQLDLILTGRNIGTLWLGLGKPDLDQFEGLEYVIMMAFSAQKDDSGFRRDMFNAKRKPLEEIWIGDPIENVSNIVRFAPSACNSQPWRITHKGQELTVERIRKAARIGLVPSEKMVFYNCIDTGIFLCFLEICLQKEGIQFVRTLFPETGSSDSAVKRAVYHLLHF